MGEYDGDSSHSHNTHAPPMHTASRTQGSTSENISIAARCDEQRTSWQASFRRTKRRVEPAMKRTGISGSFRHWRKKGGGKGHNYTRRRRPSHAQNNANAKKHVRPQRTFTTP
jgi:hypothetical protein